MGWRYCRNQGEDVLSNTVLISHGCTLPCLISVEAMKKGTQADIGRFPSPGICIMREVS